MLVLGIAVGLAAAGLYKLIASELIGSAGPSDAQLAAPAPANAVLCKQPSDINQAPEFKPETAGLQGLSSQKATLDGSTPGSGPQPMLTDRQCTERWIYGFMPPAVPLAEALAMAWNSGLPFPDCARRFVQRHLAP